MRIYDARRVTSVNHGEAERRRTAGTAGKKALTTHSRAKINPLPAIHLDFSLFLFSITTTTSNSSTPLLRIPSQRWTRPFCYIVHRLHARITLSDEREKRKNETDRDLLGHRYTDRRRGLDAAGLAHSSFADT